MIEIQGQEPISSLVTPPTIARLIHFGARRCAARTILKDLVQHRFRRRISEGFATADLKDARALLDELAGSMN